MKKVAVLTTVFERYYISLFHFRWMNWFRGEVAEKLNIEIIPFYALSSYDENKREFESELIDRELNYVTLEDKSLSTKSQKALLQLKENHKFDFLMHLDSDEFISINQFRLWKIWFMKKDIFGSKKKYIFDLTNNDLYLFKGYERHPIVNGGFCISWEVLEDVDFNVWTAGLNSGLNTNELISYSNKGHEPFVLDMIDWGIVEVKSSTENQIHKLNWYKKGEYIEKIPSQFNYMFFLNHPFLKELATLY